MGRKSVAGSAIGGITETQELLDFCGEHGITADAEVIKIQNVNEAYKRMLKSDVKYRFVIDMASLKSWRWKMDIKQRRSFSYPLHLPTDNKKKYVFKYGK